MIINTRKSALNLKSSSLCFSTRRCSLSFTSITLVLCVDLEYSKWMRVSIHLSFFFFFPKTFWTRSIHHLSYNRTVSGIRCLEWSVLVCVCVCVWLFIYDRQFKSGLTNSLRPPVFPLSFYKVRTTVCLTPLLRAKCWPAFPGVWALRKMSALAFGYPLNRPFHLAALPQFSCNYHLMDCCWILFPLRICCPRKLHYSPSTC